MWKTEGLQAGARPARLRRRVRRRPARRGEEPGEGAGVQLPRQEPPLGSEAPAARALVALQRPQEQGREHAGVPAVQLDRARRLAIHLARGDRGRAALFRGGAADGRARRPDPDGRRRADAAGAGRGAGQPQGPFPDARLLPAVRRGRERRGERRGHHRRDARELDLRARRAASSTGTAAARAWRRRSRRAIFERPCGHREPGSPRRRARSCCASSPAAASTTASPR